MTAFEGVNEGDVNVVRDQGAVTGTVLEPRPRQFSSRTAPCASCTDREGPGERRTTHREFVFLDVPLVRLSTTQTVLCEVCAEPLAAIEDQELDAIDREPERNG